MPDTFTVGTQPVSIAVPAGKQVTLTNGHGATLYYKKTKDVSSSSNDGSLAQAASTTFTGGPPRWVVTASSSTNVFTVVNPDDQTDMATQAELDAAVGPFVDVTNSVYGAVGDGAADDTAAIQAAIDALPGWVDDARADRHSGGTIFFPRGIYKCTGQLNLDSTAGIRLLGAGSGRGGYSLRPASVLRFTGTGSGSFISARSTSAFELRSLGVQYTSASYTGKLVDLSHDPSGNNANADSGGFVIEDCLLGGDTETPTNTANCLLSLHKAILGTVRDCNLQYAQYGIRGGESGSYSNAITIDNCTFDNTREAALAEAGEDWRVVHCNFEGTAGQTNYGMKRLYYQADTGSSLHHLTLVGGWAGDAGSVVNWIETVADATLNLRVFGGQWPESSGAAFKLGGLGHLAIFGAEFGGTYAIDLGTPASSVGKQGAIIGNDWSQSSSGGLTNTAGHLNLFVAGNKDAFGRYQSLPWISDHITFSDHVTAPGIAAGTAAGTSPTVSIAGSDSAGRITVTSGTSPGTGKLCTVTFGRAWDSLLNNTKDAPSVILQPVGTNSATNAIQVYVTNQATTGYDLNCVVAPSGATTYIWDYFVVQ